MSDEPNHPIESELKAYARQRRVELGRPQHLPPAMRERLLREAGVPEHQRQAAAADPPEERPARLPEKDPAVFTWWPRLFMPALGLAVVVIGLAILAPRWAQLRGRGVHEEFRTENRATETELQLREKMLAKTGGQRVAQAPPTELESLSEARRVEVLKREADEGRLSLARSRTDAADKPGELDKNEAIPAPIANRPAAPAAPATALLSARTEAGQTKSDLALKDAPAEAKRYRDETLADTLATSKPEQPALAITTKEKSSFDSRATPPVASPATTTLTVAPPASAPSAVAAPLADARFSQKSSPAVANQVAPGSGQQFAQSAAPYRRNLNSPPPPPVMNNFNFEQTGEEIRIVDADGSVYLGRVQNAVTALGADVKKQSEGLAKSAAVASLDDQVPASQFVFRANGTNLSLNQTVQIEGNYFANTPDPAKAGANVDNTKRQTEQSAASPRAQTVSNLANNSAPGAGQNAQIRGKVTIGNTNQLQLNALPVQK